MSLVRLIVNPARYEGIVVEVTGYLDETGVMVLTKDHADAFDFGSGIRFSDPTSDGKIVRTCTGTYATLVGTIRMRRSGPIAGDDPGLYVLEDLQRVITIKNRSTTTCWSAVPSK